MSTISAINTRNQFRGKVIAIKQGDIVSEVEIETAAGILSAVVTTSSLEQLGLRVNDPAIALFKATEVLVAAISRLD